MKTYRSRVVSASRNIETLFARGELLVIEVVDELYHPPNFNGFREPSPYFVAHARMYASTASACVRRLSDWVNSVRSSQAACRVWITSPVKSR